MNHIHEAKYTRFSKNGNKWNYDSQGVWVGGRYPLPNLSTGFHQLVIDWFDFFLKDFEYPNNARNDPKVLLVSEGKEVKEHFKSAYKHCEIFTTDLHWDLQSKPDIIGDLCKAETLPKNEYDIIINHSVIEHVYDPFGAMKNMVNALKKGGYLITGTHPPAFRYHQFPRDYIRFVIDWWYDLPQFIPGIELEEFFQEGQSYVFSCYYKK